VALPGLLSTTERLEAALESLAPDQSPSPMGCLSSLMGGIEGDGSLASFLAASILIREILEFGRYGRYAAGSTIALWRPSRRSCPGSGGPKCRRIFPPRLSYGPMRK